MAIGDWVGGIADVAGGSGGGRVSEAQQSVALKMKAGGLRFLGREVRVVLPGVGAGLEAGGVFEIKTRLIGAGRIFQIVCEEFGFDLRAELFADGLAVLNVGEVARGGDP
jgi:hypothetical protein